eukprot:c23130_g1_i1.p2 GENE.c23130_g1_i1~~c23130_g1_i1.p2  ORF type:complete len:124 (+),score=25.76 c23130_g1_i1:1554-1925(+)
MALYHEVSACSWWKIHETQFPVIAIAARIALAIPSSQGFQERVFSCEKHVMAPKRSTLRCDVFEMQTILRMVDSRQISHATTSTNKLDSFFVEQRRTRQPESQATSKCEISVTVEESETSSED